MDTSGPGTDSIDSILRKPLPAADSAASAATPDEPSLKRFHIGPFFVCYVVADHAWAHRRDGVLEVTLVGASLIKSMDESVLRIVIGRLAVWVSR